MNKSIFSVVKVVFGAILHIISIFLPKSDDEENTNNE